MNVCSNVTDENYVAGEDVTVHVCGLDEATATNTVIVAPGDSGGPVVGPDATGDVLFNGTISARENGDNGRTVLFTDANQVKLRYGWYLSSTSYEG